MKKRGNAVIFVAAIAVVTLLLISLVFVSTKLNEKEPASPEEKALENSQKTLNAFLAKFLQDELVPETLEVKHRLTSSGVVNGSNYTYGAVWDTANAHFYANMNYDSSLANVADYNIHIFVNTTDSEAEPTTKEFAKLYFKYFPADWECRNEKVGNFTLTICESFSYKKGYGEGAGIISTNLSSGFGVFACHLNMISSFYSSKGCVKI